MKRVLGTFALLLVLLTSGCTTQPEHIEKKAQWAQRVKDLDVENFHKVDEKLYRSAQPSKEQFAKLTRFGIKNDLNLRQLHDDKEKLTGLPICYYRIPINTSKRADIVSIFRLK